MSTRPSFCNAGTKNGRYRSVPFAHVDEIRNLSSGLFLARSTTSRNIWTAPHCCPYRPYSVNQVGPFIKESVTMLRESNAPTAKRDIACQPGLASPKIDPGAVNVCANWFSFRWNSKRPGAVSGLGRAISHSRPTTARSVAGTITARTRVMPTSVRLAPIGAVISAMRRIRCTGCRIRAVETAIPIRMNGAKSWGRWVYPIMRWRPRSNWVGRNQ